MIETSESYRESITGVTRRTRLRIPLRITSPDLVWGSAEEPAQCPVSRSAQLRDAPGGNDTYYATLETNEWALDGSAALVQDSYLVNGRVGLVSLGMCDGEGFFSSPQVVTMYFSGVSILQAVTVTFPHRAEYGVAEEFTVEVLQGGSVYFSRAFTGNTLSTVTIYGIEVYVPDGIRLTVTKWSLPHRRMRLMELFPGYSAEWTEQNVYGLTIRQQANMSALTMPYGTASLTLDNAAQLFDPRNKDGVFRSIEERQAIPVEIGVDTASGTEYIPCGVYYQHDKAWKTSDGGLTIRWDLVDIIGLLSSRTFVAPDTLPVRLDGWVKELVSQLGDKFRNRYSVDPDYAPLPVTATADQVDGKSCGDILRWLCQFTGVFARADAETGYLTLEPKWSQGVEYTLDNMNDIPVISANDNLASIIFHINGSNLVVSGNTVNSANTATIDNPFITTNTQALKTAQNVLTTYGGNQVTLTGRGDPSAEIGDVATVELGNGEAMTARVIAQTLDYSSGVLADCKIQMIQADGAFIYENCMVFTQSGSWTAPAGVTSLRIIVVGGGQSGGKGAWGNMPTAWPTGSGGTYYGNRGAAGTAGTGGKVWYGTVTINPQQTFSITIGAGGVAADSSDPVDGGPSTFGPYTSAAGRVYSPSFTDIASGSAYGRTGVSLPSANSGDGGKGGSGGYGGSETWMQTGEHSWRLVHSTSPGPGYKGSDGASGCVIIYWSKEES